MSAAPCDAVAAHAIRWAEMRKEGRVVEERLPGGRMRIRIYFRVEGRNVYLDTTPDLTDPSRRYPFSSVKAAEDVLESIRSAAANGPLTLGQALAFWRPRGNPEDEIGRRMGVWLKHLDRLVQQAKRSPNTTTEYRRYARLDGHIGAWWYRRSIHGITYGDVEDWHLWLGDRGIGPKTQKNVSDAMRAFLRWTAKRTGLSLLPSDWPSIEVPEHAPRIIEIEAQARILAEIPWERRGAFLVGATEALRVGEIRACDLEDYAEGRLRVSKAVQGNHRGSPIRHTKNRSAEWRELWSPELIQWCEWRLEQATPAARLKGEVALFWNPRAANRARRWTTSPLEKQWNRACEAAGVKVAFQEGTRHATLTALAPHLSERMLRAFSRHRDGASLDHYSKPRPTAEGIVKALRREGGE